MKMNTWRSYLIWMVVVDNGSQFFNSYTNAADISANE